MIKRLEKLAETDRDFAATLKVFNQEKDQSALDGALKKILEKTLWPSQILKHNDLPTTPRQLTSYQEKLNLYVESIENLISEVGDSESELQKKLKSDVDIELQKGDEYTSLEHFKALVIEYEEPRTAPHQEPGGAEGAARRSCIQSIRNALSRLRVCGARPLSPH